MHRIVLLALGIVLLAPVASTAATFVDIDDESYFRTLDPGETVSGTFDIVNPGNDCFFVLCDQGGFDPATQEIEKAIVAFTFLEYGDLEFTIDLGQGSQILTESTNSWYLHFEVAWLGDDALGDLNQDGLLAWSLTNTESSAQLASFYSDYCEEKERDGDDAFKLKFAKLAAVTAPIPEPGSGLLFAAGFGVVGVTVRRLQRC